MIHVLRNNTKANKSCMYYGIVQKQANKPCMYYGIVQNQANKSCMYYGIVQKQENLATSAFYRMYTIKKNPRERNYQEQYPKLNNPNLNKIQN